MKTDNHTIPQHTTRRNLQTRLRAIGPSEWAIIHDGQKIDTAYGTYHQALNQLDEWRRAFERETSVEASLGVPIDELPDDYWLNGHVPPLVLEEEPRVIARIERERFYALQWSDGKVTYEDKEPSDDAHH